MDVLVARLEPPRRVRRISWLGGGAVAIAAGTIVANISPTDPCARSDLAAVEVWSGQTRDRVAGALVGDGTAFSRDTTARVTERLDHYAALLGAEQRDACEDYHRGGQSHEALDLRGACLDERLDELSALIGAFATADDEVRRNAVTATDALTPVTICSDVEALKMRLPLPNDPAVRLRVSELERTRAAVEAQFRAGRYREGLDAANALVAAAREVDHAATVARVLRVRGELLRRLARHDELVVDLREAWVMALGAADEATAAAAVVDLAHALALARSFEEAQLRVTEAEAMVQRLQRYDPVGASALGTRLDEARGLLALRQHRYDDAVSFYERSLAVTERETGADSLRTSQALSSLASARLAQSAWEDSLALFERVLAIRIRHLGPAHPEVAQTHNSIGLTLKNMDRLDEAEAELDEARAALAATLGPEDSSLHMIDVNLAELYFRQRRYSRCAEQWSAVLGIEGVASAAHVFELHRVGRYAEALFQTSRVAEARLVADVARRRMGAFEADADALAVARSLDRLDQLLLSDGTFGRPEPATAGDKAP
jgi:tetratricopeptide (TPR) repeat protein